MPERAGPGKAGSWAPAGGPGLRRQRRRARTRVQLHVKGHLFPLKRPRKGGGQRWAATPRGDGSSHPSPPGGHPQVPKPAVLTVGGETGRGSRRT